LKPYFEADVDFSAFSGIYDLYANIPVRSNLNIVSSLPYSTYADDEESESEVGNLYIGLQMRQASHKNKSSIISFGAFLPTAGEDDFSINFLSALANYYQLEKYLPNTLTIYGNYSHHIVQSRGGLVNFEIGPNILIPTKDDDDETELLMHYGISGGFQFTNFAVLAELVGLVIISEDVDDFSDRFIHTLAFGGQWTGSAVRPGIFYKIYLKEDFRDFIDGVLGIKLDVALH
jgi:hypothetical protein